MVIFLIVDGVVFCGVKLVVFIYELIVNFFFEFFFGVFVFGIDIIVFVKFLLLFVVIVILIVLEILDNGEVFLILIYCFFVLVLLVFSCRIWFWWGIKFGKLLLSWKFFEFFFTFFGLFFFKSELDFFFLLILEFFLDGFDVDGKFFECEVWLLSVVVGVLEFVIFLIGDSIISLMEKKRLCFFFFLLDIFN